MALTEFGSRDHLTQSRASANTWFVSCAARGMGNYFSTTGVADLAAKRDLIQSADACTVTFTKANGMRRVMRVEARKVAEHVKGDAATRTGRIASHTRAFRHPNLLPVWDAEARAIKSVNLNTVTVIKTRTQTHTF